MLDDMFQSMHRLRDGARAHGRHAIETLGVDAWKRTVALVAMIRREREEGSGETRAIRRHRAGYGIYTVAGST
jgi:hypothetical protein